MSSESPVFDECGSCEGTGYEAVPRPSFFDPYATGRGGRCRWCDGRGYVEVETEPAYEPAPFADGEWPSVSAETPR